MSRFTRRKRKMIGGCNTNLSLNTLFTHYGIDRTSEDYIIKELKFSADIYATLLIVLSTCQYPADYMYSILILDPETTRRKLLLKSGFVDKNEYDSYSRGGEICISPILDFVIIGNIFISLINNEKLFPKS